MPMFGERNAITQKQLSDTLESVKTETKAFEHIAICLGRVNQGLPLTPADTGNIESALDDLKAKKKLIEDKLKVAGSRKDKDLIHVEFKTPTETWIEVRQKCGNIQNHFPHQQGKAMYDMRPGQNMKVLGRTDPNDPNAELKLIIYKDKSSTKKSINWAQTLTNLKAYGESLGYTKEHFKSAMNMFVAIEDEDTDPTFYNEMNPNEMAKDLLQTYSRQPGLDQTSFDIKQFTRPVQEPLSKTFDRLRKLAHKAGKNETNEILKKRKVDDILKSGLMNLTAGKIAEYVKKIISSDMCTGYDTNIEDLIDQCYDEERYDPRLMPTETKAFGINPSPLVFNNIGIENQLDCYQMAPKQEEKSLNLQQNQNRNSAQNDTNESERRGRQPFRQNYQNNGAQRTNSNSRPQTPAGTQQNPPNQMKLNIYHHIGNDGKVIKSLARDFPNKQQDGKTQNLYQNLMNVLEQDYQNTDETDNLLSQLMSPDMNQIDTMNDKSQESNGNTNSRQDQLTAQIIQEIKALKARPDKNSEASDKLMEIQKQMSFVMKNMAENSKQTRSTTPETRREISAMRNQLNDWQNKLTTNSGQQNEMYKQMLEMKNNFADNSDQKAMVKYDANAANQRNLQQMMQQQKTGQGRDPLQFWARRNQIPRNRSTSTATRARYSMFTYEPQVKTMMQLMNEIPEGSFMCHECTRPGCSQCQETTCPRCNLIGFHATRQVCRWLLDAEKSNLPWKQLFKWLKRSQTLDEKTPEDDEKLTKMWGNIAVRNHMIEINTSEVPYCTDKDCHEETDSNGPPVELHHILLPQNATIMKYPGNNVHPN